MAQRWTRRGKFNVSGREMSRTAAQTSGHEARTKLGRRRQVQITKAASWPGKWDNLYRIEHTGSKQSSVDNTVNVFDHHSAGGRVDRNLRFLCSHEAGKLQLFVIVVKTSFYRRNMMVRIRDESAMTMDEKVRRERAQKHEYETPMDEPTYNYYHSSWIIWVQWKCSDVFYID